MTNHQYEDYERLLGSLSFKIASGAKSRKISVDVDDLKQEAWLTFYKASEKFDPEHGVKFSTYLYRAARNNLLRYVDTLNSQIRAGDSLDAEIGEDGGSLYDLIDSGTERPEDAVLRVETERKNLHSMSDAARQVVLLLNEPSPELVKEVTRLKAFSEVCAARKFASPNVKLDANFIYRALGMTEKQRRSVQKEIKAIIEGMEE